VRFSPEKLRVILLGVAAIVVIAVLAVFVRGRFRQSAAPKDLPQRLGINVQQDSNGFTLSKSQGGRELFVIHASRTVQYKGVGRATLHDVDITIYGRNGNGEADHIAGSAFSYDPSTGIVTAEGEVQIDLSAAAALKPGADNSASLDGKTVHVVTSGLTFEQKTGRAFTDQPVKFNTQQIAGTARGANYDSSSRTLILESAVRITTLNSVHPSTITATHATYLSEDHQVIFEHGTLRGRTDTASADHAILWLNASGAADHLDATGSVLIQTDDGGEVRAPTALITFAEQSQIKQAHLFGGVAFAKNDPASNEHAQGQSAQAWLDFDTRARPAHMRLLGAVQFDDRTEAQHQTAKRHLQAGEVNVAFSNGVASLLRATNSPQTNFEESSVNPHGVATSSARSIKADVLESTLYNGRALDRVHGIRNTVMVSSSSTGENDTSRGDDLVVQLARPRAPNGPSTAAATQSNQIVSAVQSGNVHIVRVLPAVPGKPAETDNAVAERAEYLAATEAVTLSGSPRMNSPTATITANHVVLYRVSGNAAADGAVKVTYASSPQSTPVHVVAGHVVFDHASSTATFTDRAHTWQGGDSVSAPTISFTQQPQSMRARAKGNDLVHTVMVNSSQPAPGKTSAPVRVVSQALDYEDVTRIAAFSGQVALQTGDITMHAGRADVYLSSPQSAAASNATQAVPKTAARQTSNATPQFSGDMERIVASGQVLLLSPGRRGTGDKLVYTTADEKFVLSGSSGRLPRLEDAVQGAVSGDSLIFWQRDDRVEVESSSSHRAVVTTHTTGQK
jgi:lipopolysaccharide export system protein LptA